MTPKERQRRKEVIESSYSVKEAAQRLNLTRNQVKCWMRYYGIKPRKKPKNQLAEHSEIKRLEYILRLAISKGLIQDEDDIYLVIKGMHYEAREARTGKAWVRANSKAS